MNLKFKNYVCCLGVLKLSFAVNLKRSFNCVPRNIPQEMEEASCKKMCVDTSNNNSEDGAELSEGANSLCETQLQIPDDRMLDELSQDCCGFYKTLGRRLGVNHEKIEEISEDHINYRSPPEKCYQVLHEWKESKPAECTNEALEKALRNLRKNLQANKYFGRK